MCLISGDTKCVTEKKNKKKVRQDGTVIVREEPPRTCDRTSGRKTEETQDGDHQVRCQNHGPDDYSHKPDDGRDETDWMVF